MEQKELSDEFIDFTKQSSSNTRFLLASGVGIIWIFKSETNIIPDSLTLPLFIFSLAFILDILQYFIPSVFLKYKFTQELEHKKSGTTSPLRKILHCIVWWIYLIKTIMLFVGFIMVALYISQKCINPNFDTNQNSIIKTKIEDSTKLH